jgi:hypothetical protein
LCHRRTYPSPFRFAGCRGCIFLQPRVTKTSLRSQRPQAVEIRATRIVRPLQRTRGCKQMQPRRPAVLEPRRRALLEHSPREQLCSQPSDCPGDSRVGSVPKTLGAAALAMASSCQQLRPATPAGISAKSPFTAGGTCGIITSGYPSIDL